MSEIDCYVCKQKRCSQCATTLYDPISGTDAYYSIRDRFAAAALPAVLLVPQVQDRDWTAVAEHAYALADAMLKARGK